ncbi:hypothetical protein [Microcoleus sp. FACHB-1515]|nr:hypothetical protein [Microcoleus sp. FACHB-1515]
MSEDREVGAIAHAPKSHTPQTCLATWQRSPPRLTEFPSQQ